MIKYELANEEQERVKSIIEKLELDYIDTNRVRVVYSYGAKTKAIARIWGTPKVLSVAFGIKPLYVIELVWEKYSRLSDEDKLKVLIHEILHIPKSFSGGLRPHGKEVNQREVKRLLKKLRENI
ncbi:MAG: putative metallopeptidase [Sulfolobaceae archaeon]